MTLPRTSSGLAAGLLIAAAIAWRIGGADGLGTILGYSFGAFFALIAVAWQAHWLRVQPARAVRAQLEGFTFKLAAVAVFTCVFRFVEQLSQLASWQAFLLAFAAAALIVLPLAAWDLSKLIAGSSGGSTALGSRRTA